MSKVHGALAELKHADMNEQSRNPDAPPVISVHGRKSALLDRMIVQQGVFMHCHNIGGDIESILSTEISKFADPKITALCKLKIAADQKPLFMRKLRAMNVTASSLLPGLDGIGRHLDEFVRNRFASNTTVQVISR
jgi:hypothetical protein